MEYVEDGYDKKGQPLNDNITSYNQITYIFIRQSTLSQPLQSPPTSESAT